MVEFECPFCDGAIAMEPAAFVAPGCRVRCEGCSVELAFDAPAAELARAA
jgi:hypothetical protein